MSAQLGPMTNCKNIVVYTIVAALLNIFLGSSTNAATTWTITITAVGNNPLNYAVDPPSGGCPYQPQQDPKNLYICKGDTVQWQAITAGDDPTKRFNKLTIFQDDFVLLGKDGYPEEGFQASNGNLTEGGMTDPTAVLYVPHEYHVFVFDKVTKLRYREDPKIIIGGTSLEVLIKDLQMDCTKLRAAIDLDVPVIEDKKKLMRDQADKVCDQVETLKKFLPPGRP